MSTHEPDSYASPEETREKMEEAIRSRDSLQLLRVELQGSVVGLNGIVFRLTSTAGEHDVELRRRNWAQLDPNEVANFVAQKVVNEIRWRRNRV